MKRSCLVLGAGLILVFGSLSCGSSTSNPVDSDLQGPDSKQDLSGPDGQNPDLTNPDLDAIVPKDVGDNLVEDLDSTDPGDADAIDLEAGDLDSTPQDTDTFGDTDALDDIDVSEDPDGDSEVADPDVCVAILIDGVESTESVVDFGTVVRGHSAVLHASLCNRCTPELMGVLNDGMIHDGVCGPFTVANVKDPQGNVIDLGDFDPILLLQLLTVKIQKGECLTVDIIYDTARTSQVPAHLECEVGGGLSDGNTHSRILRGRAVESGGDLDQAACIATGLNCYLGDTCYAAGLWNGANTCTTCVPGDSDESKLVFANLADGTFCDDFDPLTTGDQCQSGVCAGTLANQPPALAAMATGTKHNCALTVGGDVYCWGRNDHGEAGADPSVVDFVPTPVLVGGLSGVATAVGAGRYHSCAAMQGGGAMCWGYNYDGELGNGTSTDSAVPTAVSNLTEVVSEFSGGEYHMCARLASGAVKCWGLGSSGELGNGATDKQYTPVDVTLPAAALSISAEYRHTCAVLATGRVMCWGRNDQGQLGAGTENSSLPVEVLGIDNAVKIELGSWHSCALLATGQVACWGSNKAGEYGVGYDDVVVPPLPVFFLGTTTALAAAYQHTCALSSSGSVQCWGYNDGGVLGSSGSSFPLEMWGMESGVAAIYTGAGHGCAIMAAGGVRCWGENDVGQLGAGALVPSTTHPVEVVW